MVVVATLLVLVGLWVRTSASNSDGPLLPLTDRPYAAAADAAWGYAFIATTPPYSDTGHVTIVDMRTGQLLRTTPVGYNPLALAIDQRRGRVFVVDNGGGGDISILDARTGLPIRTIPYGLAAPQTALVDSRAGTLLVEVGRTRSYAMDAYDTKSGRFLHLAGGTIKRGFNLWVTATDEQTSRAFLANTVMGREGVDAATVRVFDTNAGMFLRAIPVGYGPVGLAVDEMATRVVVTSEGSNLVHILDARSGAIVRTVRVAPGPGTVVVDPRTGHAFILHAVSGRVTILDTRSGHVLRSISMSTQPVAAAVDMMRGRVTIGCMDEAHGVARAIILDTRTGNVLKIVGLSVYPRFVLDDSASGHVLVAGVVLPVSPKGSWLPDWLRQPLIPPANDSGGGVVILDIPRL